MLNRTLQNKPANYQFCIILFLLKFDKIPLSVNPVNPLMVKNVWGQRKKITKNYDKNGWIYTSFAPSPNKQRKF